MTWQDHHRRPGGLRGAPLGDLQPTRLDTEARLPGGGAVAGRCRFCGQPAERAHRVSTTPTTTRTTAGDRRPSERQRACVVSSAGDEEPGRHPAATLLEVCGAREARRREGWSTSRSTTRPQPNSPGVSRTLRPRSASTRRTSETEGRRRLSTRRRVTGRTWRTERRGIVTPSRSSADRRHVSPRWSQGRRGCQAAFAPAGRAHHTSRARSGEHQRALGESRWAGARDGDRGDGETGRARRRSRRDGSTRRRRVELRAVQTSTLRALEGASVGPEVRRLARVGGRGGRAPGGRQGAAGGA